MGSHEKEFGCQEVSIVKRRRCLPIVISALFLAVGGCGGSEQKNAVSSSSELFDAQSTLGEYVYVADFLETDDKIEQISVCGNELLYTTAKGEVYLWDVPEDTSQVSDLKGATPLALSLPDGEPWRQQVQLLTDGGYLAVCDSFMEDEKGDFSIRISLIRLNANGEQLYCTDISSEFADASAEDFFADGDGNVYIRNRNAVFVYDAAGSFVERLAPPGEEQLHRLAADGRGNVYAALTRGYGEGEDVIRGLSYPQGFSETAWEGFSCMNGFACGADQFLTTISDELYSYDTVTGKMEPLLLWSNCGISLTDVVQFLGTTGDRILVLLDPGDGNDGSELAILSRKRREEVTEKQTLVLGMLDTNNDLAHAIAEFNRENKQYRVEIKQYLDDYTALHMDIISGRCPDIVNMNYADLENYAEKGLFLDLQPLYTSSGKLELPEDVIRACTFDGKLVALPKQIRVRTMVGTSRFLQGTNQWTLSQMIEFMGKEERRRKFYGNAENVLEYCMVLNLPEFVDFETGTCDFRKDEFRAVLEFCRQFAGNEENTREYSPFTNEYLLTAVRIRDSHDVTVMRQLPNSSQGITFVGFPTPEGTSGHILEAMNGYYAISASSDKKEGAWQFLESMLTDRIAPDRNNWFNGFPADRATREQYFARIMEQPYREPVEEGRRNAEFYEPDYAFYVPLPEEIDPIVELIDSARVVESKNEQILQMICEESRDYFDGLKSVDEAMAIIQSRVETYLAEKN